MSDRIKGIADDIQNSLKSDSSAGFVMYLLTIDETTDLSNTVHVAIFIYTWNNYKTQHTERIPHLEIKARNN